MKCKVVTGIMVLLLLTGLFAFSFNVQTVKAHQVFSDDFDDGDISDWTVTTTGDATFDVSTDTSVSSPYSLHMRSLGDYKAMGVSPSYSLDLTKDYTVSFYFSIPDTDNHWFEVFNNHQIYLVIDSNDDFKCYNGNTSFLILELTTNQWYPIEIKAHPFSSSYDVYVNGTFERTCSMWIHTGLENNFRIGDRADGSTDRGEAYWDDIQIYQDTSPPEIVIISPENTTYSTTSVPLTFTVNETASWIGYSLDNQANVTITGNTTLSGLSSGPHNIIVYANDTCGNMGSSDKVYFLVEASSEETVIPYFGRNVVLNYTASANDSDPKCSRYSLNSTANYTFSPPDENGVINLTIPRESMSNMTWFQPNDITIEAIPTSDGHGKLYTLNNTGDVDIKSMTNDTGMFFWKDGTWHPAREEWMGDGTPDPAGSSWTTVTYNVSIYSGHGTNGPLLGRLPRQCWSTTGFSENTVVEPASRLNGFYINRTGVPYSSPFVGGIATYVFTQAYLNSPISGGPLDVQSMEDLTIAPEPAFVATLFSPANLYVTDPVNRHIGSHPNTGEYVNEIDGAFYSGPGSHPQRIVIPDPVDGVYDIKIVGTSTGEFTLVVELAMVEKMTSEIYTGDIFVGGVLQTEANVSEGGITSATPVSTIGDANQDGIVDIVDIVICALAFGSETQDNPETPWDETENWNPLADLNLDQIIDIVDLVKIAIHFGEHV